MTKKQIQKQCVKQISKTRRVSLPVAAHIFHCMSLKHKKKMMAYVRRLDQNAVSKEATK